jgi:hypothetical protein
MWDGFYLGCTNQQGDQAMMNQTSTNTNQTIVRVNDNPAANLSKGNVMRDSRMIYSRLIGALFLAGFLVYGVGFGLATSVISAPDFLATISVHQTILVAGAFLMLLNTVVDVGKGVLFFPILEQYGKRSALAYLAALIVQVVLLDIGVLCLLMIIPLSQYAQDAGSLGRSRRLTPDLRQHHGLPHRPSDARRRSHLPLRVAVPHALAPWLLCSLGFDRLRHSSGRSHRGNLRLPCQPLSFDPRWTL